MAYEEEMKLELDSIADARCNRSQGGVKGVKMGKQRGYIDWLVVCIVGSIIGLILLIGWAMVEDVRAWERFKTAHKCKVVAQVRGDVFSTVGVGANGQMTIGVGSTPDKKGWLCDDGMTYYR